MSQDARSAAQTDGGGNEKLVPASKYGLTDTQRERDAEYRSQRHNVLPLARQRVRLLADPLDEAPERGDARSDADAQELCEYDPEWVEATSLPLKGERQCSRSTR